MNHSVWVELAFDDSGFSVFTNAVEALMSQSWSPLPDRTLVPWALGSAIGVFDHEGVRVDWEWSPDFDWNSFVQHRLDARAVSIKLFRMANAINVSWSSAKPSLIDIEWYECPQIWTDRVWVPDLSFPTKEIEELCKRYGYVIGSQWIHVYA